MTRKEQFIEKANSKHTSKFDYSVFKYINAKTKGIIKCPEHGEFEQTPDKHLQSVHGCPECALNSRIQASKGRSTSKPLKYTWTEMKSILLKKFPTGYTFSCGNYTGTQSTIVVDCLEHGKSFNVPHNLLHSHVKNACRECGIIQSSASRTDTFQEFVTQASLIYNGKYTYTSSTYVNKKSKVECECPIHGRFIKSAQKHLAGQHCPKCTKDALVLEGKLPGGYCETIFSRSDELKDKQGVIYYLKVGNFYKIGITINLNQRLNAIKSKTQSNVELIDFYKTTLYEAYKLEQEILKNYKEFRTKTEASTELFVRDVLDGKIFK